MKTTLLAVLSILALTACNTAPSDPLLPPGMSHPGEDTAGVGMRMQLVPEAAKVGSVKQAATVVAQQEEVVPDTYLCVCPPPEVGDLTKTRTCVCQVEGAPAVPDVCGDGILNTETENCDLPGSDGIRAMCPSGFHCNLGGEKADDGVIYPACYNCVRDAQ